MHPKGRAKCGIRDQGKYDDQRAYDHDKEGGRPITNVEAVIIQLTIFASVGELAQPSEKGLAAALGAETKKGSLSDAGLPFCGLFVGHLCVHWCAPATPNVDGDEEEEPHDVDKVPIPCRSFKTKMLLRREMALVGTCKADRQENGAYNDVKAMETSRHVKCRAIIQSSKWKRRLEIFISLNAAEKQAEK